jgi:hypothetical protein
MSLYSILKAQHEELGRKLEETTRLNNEHLERAQQLLAKLQQLNTDKQ